MSAINQRERFVKIANAATAEKLGEAWGCVPPEAILLAVQETIENGASRLPEALLARTSDAQVRTIFLEEVYPRIAKTIADILRMLGEQRGRSGGLPS